MERTVPPRDYVAPEGRQYDVGLRKYLTGIFAYMGGGLVLSALVAFAVVNFDLVTALIFGTPLKWLAIFTPLALVMFASFRFDRLSVGVLQGLFWGFAALIGVSLASALRVFTSTSIVTAFLSASILFLTMALWGYTTKRDLSGWGSFPVIGLIGNHRCLNNQPVLGIWRTGHGRLCHRGDRLHRPDRLGHAAPSERVSGASGGRWDVCHS